MYRSAYAVIAIACIFWVATIRTGTSWGDDWALYVHHAMNIVNGKTYNEVGFLYNEYCPPYSPKSYPPGFPIILAPFYAIGGINYTVLKVPVMFSFFAMLAVLAIYLRKYASAVTITAVITALAFNPFMWDSKDNILSDIPFALMTVTCLLLIDRIYIPAGRSYPGLMLTGFAIYFAYSIRVLGALLLPALLFYDIFVWRKISRKFVVVFATFSFFILMQAALLPMEGSYLEMFREYRGMNMQELTGKISYQIDLYVEHFSDFWMLRHEAYFSFAFLSKFSICFLIISFVGLCIRSFTAITPLEIFTALFCATIIIYPGFQGARYFVPVLPFMMFYAFSVSDRISFYPAKYIIYISLLIPMGMLYFSAYNKAEWGNIQYGIHERPAQQLFEFVRSETPDNSIFALAKPRALSLFTARRATILPPFGGPEEMISYLQENDVNYVVTGIIGPGTVEKWASSDTDNYLLEYSNEWFKLYKTTFE